MSLQAKLDALGEARLPQLRAMWLGEFGCPPPTLRSTELLAQLIAWRLQVAAMGGLDKATLRIVTGAAKAQPPGPKLTPGTRISREWRGRTCDVEVVAGGFLYAGKTYDSLSEIARAITGVRWNGPRFFGLRKAKAA